MNLLIFTTVIAMGSAAQLPNVYLPQKQGGGAGGGFQQGGGGSHQGVSHQGGFHQGGGSHQGGAGGAGFQQGFHSSGSFQASHSGSGDTGNRRPQQEQEKNAQIIKQDQEINENGFHYNFETSNGIRMEEAGNAAQTQGGFSYKGDDGNTYTVTFTAGEGGFEPQGAHLPVAPPIPQEILAGLQQNEKDEAAGIFDDGQYHPKEHGAGQNKPGGGFSSSSSHNFGSSNHQGSFNANSGYKY